MHDPNDRWDEESYVDDGGTGLLWQTGRNIGLLLVGCLLLVGGLTRVGDPGEMDPQPAVQESRVTGPSALDVARTTAAGDEILIRTAQNGHFMVNAEIDGVDIPFLVDTGASQVILTAEDAERLGFRPDSLAYNARFQTANGEILGAPVVLRDLRIGDLEVEDVRASVIRAPMSTSLLGMSFLNRLESYEVRDEGLVLHW
jgi:clan AA aspartic protease (TIGR02281 family)